MKKRLISFIKIKCIEPIYFLALILIGKLPAKKNLVVFESFQGKQYSDNPRAIYEYLFEHNPGFVCYWSAHRKFLHNFKNKNVRYIKRLSPRWIYLMGRAQYWVTNSRMPLWIPKPKHTIYLQTWHGTPLKKLANDMNEVHIPGTTAEKYKREFIQEASNWDYLVSPNAYSTEIFRSAFQFKKTMLETGYPRNDVLVKNNNPEYVNALKRKYGLPLDKKVILYAPTWRDNQFYQKGKYRFDLNLDLAMMQQQLQENCIVILRMHYLVAENFDVSPYRGFVFNFSNHEDISELYLLSDLLITDYSSVFFDYAILKRPMIFFVYDIEEYRNHLRGFYFNFEEEAPGPLVTTTAQVIEEVKKIVTDGYQLPYSFDTFFVKFCYLECGKSSQRVVERVFLERKEL